MGKESLLPGKVRAVLGPFRRGSWWPPPPQAPCLKTGRPRLGFLGTSTSDLVTLTTGTQAGRGDGSGKRHSWAWTLPPWPAPLPVLGTGPGPPSRQSKDVHLHPEVDHDLHSLMNQIKETSPTLASRDLQSRLSSGCGSMSTAGHCLCSVHLACAVWPCERHSPSLGFRSLLTLGSTSATCSASRQAVPGQQLLYNT